VLNLVGNAIKFTESGEIVMRVAKEAREPDGSMLHFVVEDTGIGIPPEKQQVIFEAFSQADSSTTRKYGGTGLGLAISAALVKLMQGRIWVESEVGRGSRFHFTARLGPASVPAAAVASASPTPTVLEGIRALVVDDNATNRRLLEVMLSLWKVETELAGSAEAALDAMRQAYAAGRAFGIVLTDAHMPQVDGFQLAERIKRDPQLCSAVIMMLSSGGLRGDGARCRELGVAAYLTKPVRKSELREAMVQALERGGYCRPVPALVTRHSLREARQPLHILLVEDNEVNLLLATRLLEKQGHSVVKAMDGRKALSVLEHEDFDLAIIDIQMPEMDGFEFTRTIRTREAANGSHLPIIAMTAHAMKGDRERCLAAGMDAYVPKPVKSEELWNAIESLDTGSRVVSQAVR
jgi:two-component system, sensor histidine kinase and response regulator